MGKTELITLTDKQERWLKIHFKHTKNADIAKKLGVSLRSVSRLAKKRGLTKTPQFIKKCNKEALKAAYAGALAADTLFKKGEYVPGGIEYRFKKGITSRERLGNKREDQRIIKAAEKRKRTIASERRRILFGLDQRTNLRLVKEPEEKTKQRHYLRNRGYEIFGRENIAYYTEETRRSVILEKRPKNVFKFAPISEHKSQCI